MDIWGLLGLEQTCDRSAIRKAYAERAKEFNPEEHPEEFLRIREAYEKALAYAGQMGAAIQTSQGGEKLKTQDSVEGAVGIEAADGKGLDKDASIGKGTDEGAGGKGLDKVAIIGKGTDEGVGGKGLDKAAAIGKGTDEGVGGKGLDEDAAREGVDGKSSGQESGSSASGFHWDFTEENPFRKGEGICKFRELYTGKRRKDRTAWADYFVSDAFLKGYREKDFAELMLEVVRETAAQDPPNKEFLTELYITYGLSAYKTMDEDGQPGMALQMDQTAPFSGMEYIVEIARMGPAITRFKGNDPFMIAGFQDYRELLMLARKEVWDDAALIALGKKIDKYTLSNISDRPIWNADQYELSPRHPKSLKLLTFFFADKQSGADLQATVRTGLPAEAYRMLWSHLGLESATHGREKLLYGGLREAVLAHVPGILNQPKIDYNKLNQEVFYNFYRGGITHYGNEGQTPEEREKLDQFLQREDVQIALRDEGYMDKQIARYWISRNSGSYLLDRLEAFYSVHRDMPLAGHVLDKIKTAKGYKRIDTELQEDTQYKLVEGGFDIQNRACLRHYLHTAFHLAMGLQNQVILKNYLQDQMPYAEEWSRQFAGAEAGQLEGRHPLEIRFGEAGEDILSIMFHPRHVEYLWNGSPLVPRFPGQALAEVEDDTYFWLLVPVAAAPYEEYPHLCQELTERLSRLPVWEGDIPVIADCIAGSICCFEEDQMPLCTLYAEKKEQLYGCDIYGDGTLIFYEETNDRKITLSQTDHMPDMETAIKMGRRLLRELTVEWDVDVQLEVMPEQVFVKDKWNIPHTLSGEEVTEEEIHYLLQKYFKGRIRRLELDFGGRALVFLKDGEMKRYACLYFEHLEKRWFRLVGMPEVYEVVDEKDVVYEPFGLGMLPNYVIHHSLGYMESKLEEVFAQVACEEPNPAFMTWSSQVYFTAESQQYHLAQRLFGGFPPERACNRLQKQFYIPVVPTAMSYTDENGKYQKEIENAREKGLVQDMLARYLAGRLDRLAFSWEYSVEYAPGEVDVRNRCIVLVRDQGAYQMIFFDDSESGVQYLVANVDEYRKAEGKKYRKVDFGGRTVPGYLVHTDMRRIRDYLDLLIPQIENPAMILGQFGEFAYVSREECEENDLLL